MVLMCDDISQAKITTEPPFDNAKCKFYYKSIPKAVKMKRIPTWKLHKGKFEQMSHKQGLVVNFDHVTLSIIRPIMLGICKMDFNINLWALQSYNGVLI